MSSKKTNEKQPKSKSKDTKSSSKTTIPKEWKEESKDLGQDVDKGKRRNLISTLKRSISLKGEKTEVIASEPMNIVITLNPSKHLDIIDFMNENVPAKGRPEWVRDSMRLKMRIERGVYGLSSSGQEGAQTKDTEETLQTVFGQFAEVMTKVMTDLRTSQPVQGEYNAQSRPRPPPPKIDAPSRGGPPQLKKVESEEKKADFKPERPSLDDAIGSIIVVE
ncbi:MAG: hypothetical protein ACFFDW_00440 [Candidatus Thorarchaeota archaeon]